MRSVTLFATVVWMGSLGLVSSTDAHACSCRSPFFEILPSSREVPRDAAIFVGAFAMGPVFESLNVALSPFPVPTEDTLAFAAYDAETLERYPFEWVHELRSAVASNAGEFRVAVVRPVEPLPANRSFYLAVSSAAAPPPRDGEAPQVAVHSFSTTDSFAPDVSLPTITPGQSGFSGPLSSMDSCGFLAFASARVSGPDAYRVVYFGDEAPNPGARRIQIHQLVLGDFFTWSQGSCSGPSPGAHVGASTTAFVGTFNARGDLVGWSEPVPLWIAPVPLSCAHNSRPTSTPPVAALALLGLAFVGCRRRRGRRAANEAELDERHPG